MNIFDITHNIQKSKSTVINFKSVLDLKNIRAYIYHILIIQLILAFFFENLRYVLGVGIIINIILLIFCIYKTTYA